MLDIQLPDLDGFAVAERLARNGVHPAIVLISSRDVSSFRRRLGRQPGLELHPEERALRGGAHRSRRLTPCGRFGSRSCRSGRRSGSQPNGRRATAANSALAVADLAVGWILIGCGLVAWDRRPESRVGALMSLAGFTWFLGTAFEPALYLHRGPLVHLLLSYPTGRLPTRLARAVVIAAYVDGAIVPLARNDVLTLALSIAVAGAALWGFLQARRVPRAGPPASALGGRCSPLQPYSRSVPWGGWQARIRRPSSGSTTS